MRPTRLPASVAKPSAASTSIPASTAPLPGNAAARGRPLPARARASSARMAPAAPRRIACKSIVRKNPRVLYTGRPRSGQRRFEGVAVRIARQASLPCPPARRFFASLLLLSWLLVPAAIAEAPEQKFSRSDDRWVKRTLERMTLDEKVGQLLMVPYYGGFANTDSEEFLRLARQIRELHVGGLIVSTRPQRPTGFERSEIYGLAQLTNRLQQLAPVPVLVAADFERGAGFRVRDTTSFPHNMTLGAAGDTELAYRMGRIAASEARALGVHWLLAPVVDVNNNPLNPIINIRSFGEDPAEVGRLAAAFIRGCQEAGALCTAKHFPGLGDTSLDPHLELAAVGVDRARLEQVELVPFKAAIAGDVAAVMTEHIVVPALDPEPVAATFSRPITTGLLRNQLGFEGLVITDDVSMNAIANHIWPGEAAVRAFEAGADVILSMSRQPEVAFASLKRAVESGRLREERLNQSVERILRAKARLGRPGNRRLTWSRWKLWSTTRASRSRRRRWPTAAWRSCGTTPASSRSTPPARSAACCSWSPPTPTPFPARSSSASSRRASTRSRWSAPTGCSSSRRKSRCRRPRSTTGRWWRCSCAWPTARATWRCRRT